MATLKEQLKADLTTNLKARNELETTTLRGLIGTIQTQEKSGKVAKDFNDAEILQVLATESKKRLKTADEYEGLGVLDRAARERAEAAVIAGYLPRQLSEAEVEALVDAEIAKLDEVTPRSTGLVMKGVMVAADGATTGQVVSAIVRRKLA